MRPILTGAGGSTVLKRGRGEHGARGWSALSEPTTGTNPESTGSNSRQAILRRGTALNSLQEAMEKCAKKAFTLTIRPLRLPRRR
ncbi:uncharacterized [Tachysurus ichikawai]